MKGTSFRKDWTRLIKTESIPGKGQEDLGILELAEGVVISKGKVTVSHNGGVVTKRVSGDLRLLGYEDVEAGGFLDAEIISDPDDRERIYLGTLLKDAYLHIGKNVRLQGGTMRFEYCSKSREPGKPPPYRIDEMDELLFQCTNPLPLGAIRIVGVGNDPVTLSLTVNAPTPENVSAYISLYPASIAVPGFGKNTIVFLAGEQEDSVVEMFLKNPWSNFLSTSPHFHLVAPCDPAGPPLVEGAGLLTGRLECRGLSCTRLTLSSQLNYAAAFPRSNWPQELPSQEIFFSIAEDGEPQLKIIFNPLTIDGYSLYDAGGKNKNLAGSLCDTGFSFKGEFLVSPESSDIPPRPVSAFVVDNHCRVRVVVGDKKMEIRDWIIGKP